MKTKYQIYFLDPELGGWPTLQGDWGSELAGFGDLSEAEHVVAELGRVYPGTSGKSASCQKPTGRPS